MKSFTIYKEYYELSTFLSVREQEDFWLKIIKYMFEDIEPSLNTNQQKIFDNLRRPLDKSKKRSKSGSTKSNENQNEIKIETNKNQNENKTKTHQDVYVNVNNLENKKDIRGMGEEEEEETFANDKKIQFADFVTMTNAEYAKLVSTYSKEFADRCIEKLSNYKGASGKKYKSDYRAIKNWVVDTVKKTMKEPVSIPNWFDQTQTTNGLNANEYDEMEKLLSDIGCEK